jgi:hypothetical protein
MWTLSNPLKALSGPFAFALLCSLPHHAHAQASVAPTAPQTVPAPAVPSRQYNAKQLADRPYSAVIPAPLFPASPRKQAQFTVQYVYNYSKATYTPEVALPLISRAAVSRTTPEGALIAYYSAMRSGDYEAWLQCWDAASRKGLEDITKQQKNGAEYWRALWRQFYANKRFILTDRLETVNYIILDARVEDPTHPGAAQQDSEILVSNQGVWTLTNAFGNDGLVMNYDGTANKAVKEFELAPTKTLTGPAELTGHAQQEFLTHHATSNSINRTVE